MIFTIVFICVALVQLYSNEFSYVGADKCKICHKTEKQGAQYTIWESTKHSKSYQALTLDETKAKVPDAPENPDCLKCHGPLHEKAPEFKEEGVTCEVCHGPGSDYKKLSVMKNREDAVSKGLIVYESEEAIKAQCLSCHEMAHDKPFDFAAAWEKIKHPKPEEK